MRYLLLASLLFCGCKEPPKEPPKEASETLSLESLFETAVVSVETETACRFAERPQLWHGCLRDAPVTEETREILQRVDAVATRDGRRVLVFSDQLESRPAAYLYDTLCHELVHMAIEERGGRTSFRTSDLESVHLIGACNEIVAWGTAYALTRDKFGEEAEPPDWSQIPRSPVPVETLLGIWEMHPQDILSIALSSPEQVRAVLDKRTASGS